VFHRSAAVLFCVAVASLASAQTPRERLAKLASDFGIEVVVIDGPTKVQRVDYNVTAEAVTDDMLAKYVPILEAEWRRYPRTLMVMTRLGRIVIGKNVRVLDQPRAAVPEFYPGWFWLDADVGSRLPTYGRHVIHHDFFHMIDEYDSPDGRTDRAWEKLNLPNVKYGNGGWFMQKGNPGVLRTDLPGFLDEYSTSAVEEDKAEIYSHLITSRDFVLDRAKLDPVIAAKVERIKALVVTFESQMDAKWWP